MTPLLHTMAGALALIGGALALATLKGGAWHRRAGTLFCLGMLAMALSGSVLALWRDKPLSLLSGLLVVYLVLSGWWTVRRPVPALRRWLVAGALAALALGAALLALGAGLLQPWRGAAGPSFVFGAIALVAAVLDLRLLHAGAIGGRHRVTRHLWRLCVAMLMATVAFFLGQAPLFPVPLRRFDLLGVPVLAVLAASVYLAARLWLPRRR